MFMVNKEVEKTENGLARRIWLFAGIVLALLIVWLGALYATSPDPIRRPSFEHYHFRMQVIVDGQREDFGQNKYQAELTDLNSCNAELTEHPIHFHDRKDQFVHIHWDEMTGGLVLKNYGWNFIGGSDDSLGYRFDNLARIKNVPRHSSSLPTIPKGAEFYVFIGDENSFVRRSFDEFKSQDLETFFGKRSNISRDRTASYWDWLFPNALAHGGVEDGHADLPTEELEEINNLIGNVVIFVQKEQPSDEQVRERFQELVPLSESSCAG